jgi:hypothetical protein
MPLEVLMAAIYALCVVVSVAKRFDEASKAVTSSTSLFTTYHPMEAHSADVSAAIKRLSSPKRRRESPDTPGEGVTVATSFDSWAKGLRGTEAGGVSGATGRSPPKPPSPFLTASIAAHTNAAKSYPDERECRSRTRLDGDVRCKFHPVWYPMQGIRRIRPQVGLVAYESTRL